MQNNKQGRPGCFLNANKTKITLLFKSIVSKHPVHLQNGGL